MIRIAHGIYTWSQFSPEKGYNFNGFVVVTGADIAVIDPPPLSDGDSLFYETMIKDPPRQIIITNEHHVRDAASWHQRYKSPIAMSEAETADISVPVHQRFRDGDRLAADLRPVHLPGKTPGEAALLHPGDGGTLIVGDALVGDPPGRLRLMAMDKIRDVRRLEESLQRLRGFPFARLLLADGEPILSGAKAAVEEFLGRLPVHA